MPQAEPAEEPRFTFLQGAIRMKSFAACLLSLLLSPLAGHAFSISLVVADRFGRAVNDAGITLVDWEGYIANPAMKYTIKAPSTRVILSSSEPRLYFNLPSWNDADGPRKELTLSGTSSQLEFYISIFPDRDGLDETHSLTIEYRDTQSRWHTESIDIHVIDQDVPNRALDFDITVDFSHDKTELFDDPAARADFVQAAEDWVYFFDDMDLDEVPAGQEQSWIWSLEGEGGDDPAWTTFTDTPPSTACWSEPIRPAPIQP